MNSKINLKRIKQLNKGVYKTGPVIYWMQRDQRVYDNWALLYAQELALRNNKKFEIIFCLTTQFLSAPLRHYDFMLKGLIEVEQELKRLNIPFILIEGKHTEKIPEYLNKVNASEFVTDLNPIKIVREWKNGIIKQIDINVWEVDAHNVIPIWEASEKQEFAAYTIRPKIHKQLDEYLTDFPAPSKMSQENYFAPNTEWEKIHKSLNLDISVNKVDWIIPGETSANKMLRDFLHNRFINYATERNDPTKNSISNLSPFFHFGQLSPQRAAFNALGFSDQPDSQKVFLEELIVRRELSDNFCYYNENYDSFDAFPQWAKDSLNLHRKDEREYIYSKEEFEDANTHDPLWNAAQLEMKTNGKMHGYIRMYWAKKILEWTKTPEDALDVAIYLNDKYELDGRDPNGYTGIAWSIGGLHDRPWFDRPVYGKIRYMNYNGALKKFDVKKYINKFLSDKNKLFS